MDDERALDHAWRYFELHAGQRITVFNYFIIFSGILSTGLAACLQSTKGIAVIGAAIGLLLALLSFVFWKLDQRTSAMIKSAEEAIGRLEPTGARLLSADASKTTFNEGKPRLWTYGRCFRTIFVAIAFAGLAGALLSGAKALSILDFGAPSSSETRTISKTR